MPLFVRRKAEGKQKWCKRGGGCAAGYGSFPRGRVLPRSDVVWGREGPKKGAGGEGDRPGLGDRRRLGRRGSVFNPTVLWVNRREINSSPVSPTAAGTGPPDFRPGALRPLCDGVPGLEAGRKNKSQGCLGSLVPPARLWNCPELCSANASGADSPFSGSASQRRLPPASAPLVPLRRCVGVLVRAPQPAAPVPVRMGARTAGAALGGLRGRPFSRVF